ncbi:hypothetical protein BH10PSE12_BH10PSE12_17360 [soil metagenome]
MHPSSELCRKQERMQLDRAEATSLDNVRRLATNAAKVWHQEALVAEKREIRQAQAKLVAGTDYQKTLDDDFMDDED